MLAHVQGMYEADHLLLALGGLAVAAGAVRFGLSRGR